ncbi:MAG TPA: tRNA pseudouridine(55) synthase TruB [Steroidobacteraceae bacterium]|nr:tRNA pseudouridine(55) synthase TruB [Steroidobacteraceae bacterium]
MPDGILLLDKPRGLSSNAALQRVRRLCGGVKAGHAGSLDPLATGMLPICLGEATKIVGDIVAGAKRYRFSIALGVRTATGDAEGAVTAEAAVPALTRAQVEAVLRGFLGPRSQVPPMYSALKQGGTPLYRLARAGQTVARAARAIELHELTLMAMAPATLEIETRCSKGTYVRVLAEEIAAALGTVGHVSALRRLTVEPFEGEPMHTLESLTELAGRPGGLPLLPADCPLRHLPAVSLGPGAAARLLQGQAVGTTAACEGRVRLYDEAGRFLGIGIADGAGSVRPKRLLNEPLPASVRAADRAG